MKNLLKKEMTLTASVLSYIFIAFTTMALIPNYPILVGAFFVCFGIFHSFQNAREAGDTLYTAMLPVKKSDVVKAKFLFTIAIQTLAFLGSILWVLMRTLFLNRFSPYSGSSLMNANLIYLSFVLLIFACFNIIFISSFYKTAYNIGIPFLKFGISAFLLVSLGEALHFFPGLGLLNADFHPIHIVFFMVSILFYSIGTWFSLKKSQTSFDKIDL